MSLLADHLLQSTALACVAALLALAFRNNAARTRHAIWMVADPRVPDSVLCAHLARRGTKGHK